ncbi:MAG: glyoxalase superfamily protein [Rhizobiaceae bacterium]
MNEYLPLPSLENLKQQAKRLRAQMGVDSQAIAHSQALELLAHQYGYRDWNTLHAASGNQPPGPPVTIGSRVSGRYLGQSFVGNIVSVSELGHGERYRVTINFDEPVDVVRFEGWSSFRRRVTSQISRIGRSPQRTSNGLPVMEIDL